jgi:hypothetical protein
MYESAGFYFYQVFNMYNAPPHPNCSSYSRLYEACDFILDLLI